MNRVIAAIMLVLVAASASALERSPDNRGSGIRSGGSGQSTSSERGERHGDRGGREVSPSRSYTQRDHDGGDHR
jgi:hypothetical protein